MCHRNIVSLPPPPPLLLFIPILLGMGMGVGIEMLVAHSQVLIRSIFYSVCHLSSAVLDENRANRFLVQKWSANSSLPGRFCSKEAECFYCLSSAQVSTIWKPVDRGLGVFIVSRSQRKGYVLSYRGPGFL